MCSIEQPSNGNSQIASLPFFPNSPIKLGKSAFSIKKAGIICAFLRKRLFCIFRWWGGLFLFRKENWGLKKIGSYFNNCISNCKREKVTPSICFLFSFTFPFEKKISKKKQQTEIDFAHGAKNWQGIPFQKLGCLSEAGKMIFKKGLLRKLQEAS